MTNEKEIRKAWEGFVEDGTTPSTVRAVVVSSWQRSQDHGVPIERESAPLVLGAELVERHSTHSGLVEAARPALRQARLFLAEANSMMILTDPSGLDSRDGRGPAHDRFWPSCSPRTGQPLEGS